jgi:glycosyltransferase involved in cell wall biosynthesis
MASSSDQGVRTYGQPLLSIIVPVYNEVKTVGMVLDRLQQLDLPLAREIIVVDDGSTDGTGELLARLEGSSAQVRVFRSQRNQGKGAAVRLGIGHAKGSIVAIQDADLELDPQQLAALVAPILDGHTDVVYGSRFMNGRPPMPRVSYYANRTLTGITNVLYRSRLTDMETCYKVMRTDVARSLGLTANRFDIEPEVTAKLLRKGHRVVERPVQFMPRSRAQGKKIGWRDAVQAVGVLCRCRFARN